jgi:DNA-binding NarL/FixJ family response regulator
MVLNSNISCFLRLGLLGTRPVRAPLPSDREEPREMGEASGTEGRRNPMRVMLADNHAMFRQSVASMLSKDGEVEVVGDAGSGPEAIEIAKRTLPDVVIMQVEQAPDAAATEIRGILEVSPASRVVVLTAHQDPRIVGERLELGHSTTVHKSATVQQLLWAIRRTIGGSPGERDGHDYYAVVGMPERMMGQVRTADEHGISARELEVLVLVGQGPSNGQIASRLHLSEATVKRHLANAYPKLGVASRGEATRKALSEGWITERDIIGPQGVA